MLQTIEHDVFKSYTHKKQIYLFLKAAAVQVMIFILKALGLSDDGINLKVNHVGHLMKWPDSWQNYYHLLT